MLSRLLRLNWAFDVIQESRSGVAPVERRFDPLRHVEMIVTSRATRGARVVPIDLVCHAGGDGARGWADK